MNPGTTVIPGLGIPVPFPIPGLPQPGGNNNNGGGNGCPQGQVRDGVEALEIVFGDLAQIPRDHRRAFAGERVEPALAIEARIQANRFDAALFEVGAKQCAHIAISAGKQDTHVGTTLKVSGLTRATARDMPSP